MGARGDAAPPSDVELLRPREEPVL
jgi:hypothetical protein